MTGVANISIEPEVDEIAFVDLMAQQRRIRERIEARLKTVLDHGQFIAGPEICELEQRLAERTGAVAAVACASGTAALIAPLLARRFVAGDAVLIPSFTYNATANAVLIANATPVFVDIDPQTFTMDPADLERRITLARAAGLTPKAVIPVDLFGAPADYARIAPIAAREDLFMLADAAQSFGGAYNGVPVGNLAPVTATSFFPAKALGAYGDAGAILTQHGDAAREWASILWHGTDAARKNSVQVGFNGRMDTMQAAVLLAKLEIFDDELEARRRIADIYEKRLTSRVGLQASPEGGVSGRSYFSICVRNRDHVIESLNLAGVPTAVYYATPLHRMEAFRAWAPKDGLPVTERIAEEILSLPIHPYLTDAQASSICDAVEATQT